MLPLIALVVVNYLGIAWSDSYIPPNGVLVLLLYFSFAAVAPSLIRTRADAERILGAFLLAAILLACMAVAQRALGVLNWRAVLVQSDDYSYRANATFADPNILAHFLAICASLALGLILVWGARRLTLYLAFPALFLAIPASVATASRSGWLTLLFCCTVVVWLAPIRRYTKVRMSLIAALCIAGLIGLLLYGGGTDAERVKSLTSGITLIGQREFLINVGWSMFRDNPVLGVGTGNFQHALLVTYIDLIPSWARTTLSHTSLVSILAELGVVGMSLMVFVGWRVGVTAVRSYSRLDRRRDRVVVGWLIAGFLAILLQSQSEGRLLDEPYLWVLFALLMVYETASWSGTAARVDDPEEEPAAVRLPERELAGAEAGALAPEQRIPAA